MQQVIVSYFFRNFCGRRTGEEDGSPQNEDERSNKLGSIFQKKSIDCFLVEFYKSKFYFVPKFQLDIKAEYYKEY